MSRGAAPAVVAVLLLATVGPASAEVPSDPFRLPPPEGVPEPGTDPAPVEGGDAGASTQEADPSERDEGSDAAPVEPPSRILRSVPLHHAEAAAVAEVLGDSGADLLSEEGRVSVDERTNTLVLHDRRDHVAEAARLARSLDEPVPQILIEARIVLTSGDYARQLGRRLGVSARRGSAAVGRDAAPLPQASGDEGFLVDLDVPDAPGQIGVSIGRVGSHLLQLELGAMEAEGQGQVVSAPRVLTAARQEASIQQGVQIPYQEVAESGATAVAFREAALSLTATPSVSPDDRIELDLHVTKDAVGQIFEGVPSIDTQVLRTRLHLRDGETAVLGGVQEQEQQQEHRRVPWLADWPLIGWLFRGRQERERYSELLIFVTPTVWEAP